MISGGEGTAIILWGDWKSRSEGATWFSLLLGWLFKYHVSVVIFYEGNQDVGIVIDPRIAGMDVYPVTRERLIDEILSDRITHHKTVPVTMFADNMHSWIEPMSCVTVVKRIIGLRSFWMLTPKQLHRYIGKHYG
jgi:hypothetical protein